MARRQLCKGGAGQAHTRVISCCTARARPGQVGRATSTWPGHWGLQPPIRRPHQDGDRPGICIYLYEVAGGNGCHGVLA